MTIRQSRYILAETDQERRVRVTEVQRAEEDPVLRRSDIQQQVSNSTLPASSRAVNLAIESINSDLDLKADKTELEGLATENYVNEKVDEKEIGITEPELISKSVGAGKWMREGAYGVGGYVVQAAGEAELPVAVGMKSGLYVNNTRGTGGYKRAAYGIFLAHSTPGYHSWLSWSHSKVGDIELDIRNPVGGGKCAIYNTANTRTDKNNVLHSGTSTPINTLNVSDMADIVVDNDLITVTSGAVFRAIKQLTDQIISLEARVRELEDGGV